MPDFNALTVQDITRETPTSVSVTFGVPSKLREQYAFKAGQYITLRKNIDGKEVRRAYSLCSTPKSGLLKVAVKEVANGRFSVIVNNKLTVGESIDVHPPEGKFILEPDAKGNRDYAAFAAGSGITPIMSLLKTVLEEEPHSRFVLVYGNKSVEETIFHSELLELQLKHPDRLFIEFFYSRKLSPKGTFGRIERSTVNHVLKTKFKHHDFAKFYLCGPEEMINTVSETLIEKGVKKEDILFELFSSSDDGETESLLEGGSHIKVIVDDEEFEFNMAQSDILLDEILEQGIDAPYSCQGGICASCIARITEGTVTMRKNQILTDDEVAEGLVLTCQSHPTSPKVTVDYDEV